MRLELKHLAAYLPYGLKLKVCDTFYQYDIMTLCDKSGLSNISIADVIDDSDSFKPILRPLSDFTNEIEVDGERFVPDAKMKELCLGSLPKSLDCNWMYYQQHQKLLEWHFDLFELIPAGLAIDINSVFEIEKNENI